MRLSPTQTGTRGSGGQALAFAFAMALVCAASASVTRTRAQEVAPQKQRDVDARAAADARAQSIIRGRVVYDDTGRPVRRAEVRIYDPGIRSGRGHRTAWTNARGEFVLRSVVAGNYFVRVATPGGVTHSLDSADQSKEQEVPTASVDGTNSAEVKVRVRRGGAISGKLTYADGEPAAGAILSLRRRRDGQLSPVYLDGGHGRGVAADDRGLYRISGLPPGEYVVGAAEQKLTIGEMEEDGSTRMSSSALSATFYPGAVSPQQATAVTVEAGREVEDIDITLVERATHAVSGAVVERGTQRPVAGAEVQLNLRDEAASRDPSAEALGTQTDQQGRWSFDEVQEGGYVLVVSPQYDHRPRSDGGAVAAATPKFVSRRQELQVIGGDVAGLTVEVSAGARVSGKVSVEGGRPLPPNVLIYSESTLREAGPQNIFSAQIGPDGSFKLEGLPAGDFQLAARAAPRDVFYAKSITAADGTDLLRMLLNVEEGGEIGGLRVLLSPDVATLTGRVLSPKGGAPAPGALVVCIPADPARRRLRVAALHAQTSADGSFRVSGAPGEYVALVFPIGRSPFEMGDAAFEARAAAAPRVTLAPGEQKRMDITMPGDK